MSRGSTMTTTLLHVPPSSSTSPPAAPPSAPTSKLRRITSFTRFFRSSKQIPPAAAAASTATSSSQPVDKPSPAPAKRTVYVPTHAASSFARTAAPPPQRTIPEEDEPPLSPYSFASRLRRRPLSTVRSTDEEADDYAAFLADADARERAREAVGWIHLDPGFGGYDGRCSPGAAQKRDSAYYSAASRSSASGPQQQQQQQQQRGMLSPHFGQTTFATGPSTRAPRRQPSNTLGRRISQYIKPPREDDVVEID